MGCRPGNRCHNWRACHKCARIRQARIADAAEKLAGQIGALDWTTITAADQTPTAIARERARWLRQANPAGAIWTIERGEDAGKLHINIIAPSGCAADLPRSAQHRIVRIENPRAVAAYISKPEQAPDAKEWPGRTFGTAGPLWQWLTAKDQHTPVIAAAIQADINRAAGQRSALPPAQTVDCAADLDRVDYRAIMARRLPDLVSIRADLRTATMLDAGRTPPT